MQTRIEPVTLFERGWIVRVRRPAFPGSQASMLILLHGWTGDERTMDVFFPRFSQSAWLFSPRGAVSTGESGYGWLPHNQRRLPDLSAMQTITTRLQEQITHWKKQFKITTDRVSLCGFSQGAALAYSFALAFPRLVSQIACLAGYLPDFTPLDFSSNHLQDLSIFVAHGTNDQTIAVESARSAVDRLAALGAHVDYCEAPVGHKVSASCLTKMEAFFRATPG